MIQGVAQAVVPPVKAINSMITPAQSSSSPITTPPIAQQIPLHMYAPSVSAIMAVGNSSPSPNPTVSSTAQASSLKTKHRPRGKNKEKHNQSESRRRDRLRSKFLELKNASQCDKKDRIAILAHATEKLRENEIMKRASDNERAVMMEQLNQVHSSQMQGASLKPYGLKRDVDGSHDSIGRLIAGFYPFLSFLPTAFIGLDGKFLDVNTAFLAMTGHTHDVLMQATIFSITPQHELTPTFFSLKRLLAGEMECWETDRLCLTADGSALPVHLTMAVAKSQGKPEFFTCFFVLKEQSQQIHSSHPHAGLQPLQPTSSATIPAVPTSSMSMGGINGMSVVGLGNTMGGILSQSNSNPQQASQSYHQSSLPIQMTQQRFDSFQYPSLTSNNHL